MHTHPSLRERALSRIAELAKNVAHPLGLLVLDVRLSQQGRRLSLEVCIFKENGQAIGLADCEQMSRALDRALDDDAKNSRSALAGPYLLEVVSPGIERQLTTAREFELFSGCRIRVRTKENIGDLGNDFICLLLGGDDAHIKINDAHPLTEGGGKIAKSKGVIKKTGKTFTDQLTSADGMVFSLELARIFKINLYAHDLKKG